MKARIEQAKELLRELDRVTDRAFSIKIRKMEALQEARNTIVGRPIQLDHSESVRDSVGKVVASSLSNGELHYVAEIYDETIANKIRHGVIQHCSIGAIAENLREDKEGIIHASGLQICELSLVVTPGIASASVMIAESVESAIREKFNQAKQIMSDDAKKEILENKKMELEQLKQRVKELEEARKINEPKAKGKVVNQPEETKEDWSGFRLEKDSGTFRLYKE